MATKQTARPRPVSTVDEARTAALRRWRAEWTRWCTSPAAAGGLARWRRGHACLAAFDTHDALVDGCGRDRSVPQRVADERLGLLVGEAQSGDREAARVVLERVLPALVRAAVRQVVASGCTFGSALDDLLTSAWLVIVQYPLERRPTKIAVNVVRDAEYRQFGYVPAAIRESVPTPIQAMPLGVASLAGRTTDDALPAAVEVLTLLADAVRAGLPPGDGRLLAELVVFGRTPEEIAARDRVTDRAIRFRRRAAIQRLAQQVAAAGRSGDASEVSA